MTTTPLDLDHAMQVVAQAFLPLGCVTGANPDGETFGFSVVDAQGHTHIELQQVTPQQYMDTSRLRDLLNEVRYELRQRGLELEDWQMPFIPDAQGIPLTPPNY